MEENFDPEVDPDDDYVIIYEAKFTPRTLDKGYAHIYFTDDGKYSFNFETYGRTQQRVNKICLTSVPSVFVVGFEPNNSETKEKNIRYAKVCS